MIAEIGNCYTIIRGTDEEVEWVSDKLGIQDRGKSEKRSMYDAKHKRFPTGMLTAVHRHSLKEGVTIDYLDKRVRHGYPADLEKTDLTWLHEHQQCAMDAIVKKRRGVVKIPTSGGKGHLAIAMAMAIPIRWLYLVHREHLTQDIFQRYKDLAGGVAGKVAGNMFRTHERFTVATFQTIHAHIRTARVKKLLAATEGIIVDETHIVSARTFWNVVMNCENAYWRIGMSGTPFDRGDNRSIFVMAALGGIIYDIRARVLISRKLMSEPTIIMVPMEHDLPGGGKWHDVYEAAIVDNYERNQAIVAWVRHLPKPCMVFVKEIKHGRYLRDQIENCGLNTAFVFGNTDARTRTRRIRQCREGTLDVLVCSVVFQEGVDIPNAQSMVVAAGGRSVIAALQRVGRVARVDEGKTTCQVVDFDDTGHRWLDRHTMARTRAYMREGYRVIEPTERP